jgi:uncharacterized cupin superfamily protein
MANFYDEWLTLWDKCVKEKQSAKRAIHADELKWERTRQDYKAALMVAPETGFRTMGGCTMMAEIPLGWKTGRHSHGEESIYFLEGSGFSIVDKRRYNWEKGTCMRIPFGSEHQHFNNGNVAARYLSALSPRFEYFAGIAKYEHSEDCGEFKSEPKHDGEIKDHDGEGRRIVLHQKDADVGIPGDEKVRAKTDAFSQSFPAQMQRVVSSKNIKYMGFYDDFVGEEQEITDIFIKKPGSASIKHAHGEAMLHILQGEGYSIIEGEKVPWRAGSTLHVQGPQTTHQHFTTGDVESHQLRIHFGLRKFVQPIAKPVFPYLYLEDARL